MIRRIFGVAGRDVRAGVALTALVLAPACTLTLPLFTLGSLVSWYPLALMLLYGSIGRRAADGDYAPPRPPRWHAAWDYGWRAALAQTLALLATAVGMGGFIAAVLAVSISP